MIARIVLAGAAVAAFSAAAMPATVLADTAVVPAPMMLGRWVKTAGEQAPTGDALQTLCANPAAYLQVTPATIRKVEPSSSVTCEMPVWSRVDATHFVARTTRCVPAPVPGEDGITVHLKGLAQMLYNDVPYVMCPTGP